MQVLVADLLWTGDWFPFFPEKKKEKAIEHPSVMSPSVTRFLNHPIMLLINLPPLVPSGRLFFYFYFLYVGLSCRCSDICLVLGDMARSHPPFPLLRWPRRRAFGEAISRFRSNFVDSHRLNFFMRFGFVSPET